MPGETKATLARSLGVARSTLYYAKKLPRKDWVLKQRIEAVLHEHPSYGARRLEIALGTSKRRIKRVMRRYGIKPYRRRPKKSWCKASSDIPAVPNLLASVTPDRPDVAWASDFTHLTFRGRTLYIATVMDVWTREIVGLCLLTNHSVHLVIAALADALRQGRRPVILHSDQGSEYRSKPYRQYAERFTIRLSMSRKSSPWENGYQESFYSQFKLDLGDPNRFGSLGELVAALYETIRVYNTTRIHTALKMPPAVFAARYVTVQEVLSRL